MAAIGLERAPKRQEKLVTPSVIRNRIRALRELCNADREALVFIPGVDGKFNDGARKALNYLLYGCSGTEIEQSSRNNPEQEEEEVHEKLLPLVGEVSGLQLFTTNEEEAADMDLSEERKIISFLEMIEPFKAIGTELTPAKIGVPTTGREGTMEVENWPLIQVYGVEELGNRGFFTMKHSVTDVAPDLRAIYARLDRHAIETVATAHVDMLAFHLETAVALLDKRTCGERLNTSEQSIAEPLLSFFNYGLLRSKNAAAQEGRRPRVAVGIRTNNRAEGNGKVTIGKGGEDGKAAVHLVLEAAEPNGPLQLARTLFLSSGGAATRVRCFDWDGNETQEQDDNRLSRGGRSAYARCLMAAYYAVMGTHEALVAEFCAGKCDATKLKALAVRTLQDMGIDWLRNSDIASNLSVELSAVDLEGSAVDASPCSRHAKYLRVELSHIMSLDTPPIDLGAVVYGDTFIDAAAQVTPLSLTGLIPRLAGWASAGQEEDTHAMVNLVHRLRASNKHTHKTMGSLIYDEALAGVRLVSGCERMPTLAGDLWALQRGLIYTTARLGSVVVDFEHHVAAAEFYTVSETVVLRLKEGFVTFGILETAPGAGGTLMLCAGTADRKIFSRELLHTWRETLKGMEIPTTVHDTLPPALAAHAAHSVGDEVAINSLALPDTKTFLEAYERLDACGHQPSSSALPVATSVGNSWPVVVILGQPGLDKMRLVREAMSLAGEQKRVGVVSYSNPVSPGLVDSAALSSLLLEDVELRRGKGRDLTVLVVSTYASAAAVAGVLSRVKGVHVDRMSAVVDATSFNFPASAGVDASVAGQCMTGFVSSVVLVNTELCRPDQVSSVQHQLRYLCPSAKLVRAVAGRVTSRDDISLLLLPDDDAAVAGSRFYEKAMVHARSCISPGWDEGRTAVDLWGQRRGVIEQVSFELVEGVTFLRAPLVMSIRGLFTPINTSLERYVAAGGAPMEVFHLTACLRVAKTANEKGEMCVVKAKRGCVTVTAADDSIKQSVCVSGRNINTDVVVRALMAGRTPILQPTALRLAEDLTREEKEAIKVKSISEPLPDGYFFNGSNFVDFEGNNLQYHPDMDRLVEEYLEKANEGLRAENEELLVLQQAADKVLSACITLANKARANR